MLCRRDRRGRIEQALRLAVIGAVLVLPAVRGEAAEPFLRVESEAGLVSVEAREAPLEALLAELARTNELDLDLEAPLLEPVSLRFEGMPLPEAVERVLDGRGYVYGLASPAAGSSRRRGTLWIFSEPAEGQPAGESARGRGGADPRLAQLIAALAEGPTEGRREAIFELIERGVEVVEVLADAALFDLEPTVRKEAILGLGEIGDEAGLPSLGQALLDPDTRVREAAIWAAAEIGGDASALMLALALSDEEASLREEAVYALGDIGGESAAQLLEQALADERPTVREAAREMLADMAAAR